MSTEASQISIMKLQKYLQNNELVKEYSIYKLMYDSTEWLLIYAVPVATINLETLEKFWTSVQFPNSYLNIVTHIPKLHNGKIDYTKLLKLPILPSIILNKLEKTINEKTGADVIITIEHALSFQVPGIHFKRILHHGNTLNDLLPPQTVNLTKNISANQNELINLLDIKQIVSKLSVANKLSYLNGGPLYIPESYPKNMVEALILIAQKNTKKGITYIQANEIITFQSYQELLQEASYLLDGLRKMGMQPKQTVILHLADTKEQLTAFWACILGGMIPIIVSVPPIYDSNHSVVKKLLATCNTLGAVPIICSNSIKDALCSILEFSSEKTNEVLAYNTLISDKIAENYFFSRPDEVLFYQLSSGSTGVPKIIKITHKGIISHVCGGQKINNFDPSNITLNWLSMDHIAPVVYVHLSNIYIGSSQIHLSPDIVINQPTRWLDYIETYKVTHSWAPNFGYKLLNESLKNNNKIWDLSSLLALTTAGEQVTYQVLKETLLSTQNFGLKSGVLRPAFGMAETCTLVTTFNDLSLDTLDKYAPFFKKSISSNTLIKATSEDKNNEIIPFVTLGHPIAGVEIRIVDKENQLITEGSIGRLQLKGDVITSGYLNNKNANDKAFTGEGWFDSEDLGFILDGNLTLSGRAKETILINGTHFHAFEIEETVSNIPGVQPTYVAACGIDLNQQGTESLIIFFVPNENLQESNFLQQEIKEKIASAYAITPAYIIALSKDIFPKTTSGKIQRNDLKNKFVNGEFEANCQNADEYFENQDTLPQWFFERTWKKTSFFPKEIINKVVKTIVIFSGLQENIGKDLSTYLNSCGYNCIFVEPSAFFKQLSPLHYNIDINSIKDYESLFETFKKSSYEISHILHFSTYKNFVQTTLSLKSIKQSYEKGIGSILHILHSLEKLDLLKQSLDLLIFSTGTQKVSKDDQLTNIENAYLPAIIKSINMEYNTIKAKHIDFKLKDKFENIKEALEYEIFKEADEKEIEISYRNKQRFIRSIEPIEILQQSFANDPIKQDSLYVITGGLGGIGYQICTYLWKKYNTSFVILGRAPITLETDNKISSQSSLSNAENSYLALKKQGCKFSYYAVDLKDEDAINNIFCLEEKTFGKQIAGVIHLAGTYHESLIKTESIESFEKTFNSKVYGSYVLSKILQKYNSKGLFISFSSLTSHFGTAMLSSYSVANRFLEVFADYLRETTSLHSYSLLWSNWNDIGVSAGYAGMRHKGIYGISIPRGLISFALSLRSNNSVTLIGLDQGNQNIIPLLTTPLLSLTKVVTYFQPDSNNKKNITFNFKDILENDVSYKLMPVENWPLSNNGSIDKEIFLKQMKEKTVKEFVPASTNLQQQIVEIWKSLLKTQDISIEENFFDLGGNSLLLLQLHGSLQKTFEISLEIVDLFRYPNILMQADYIFKKLEKSQTPLEEENTIKRSAILQETNNDIAVIGVSLRFPGANTPEEYWQNLITSTQSIHKVTPNDLESEGLDPAKLKEPLYVPYAYPIENETSFDSEFFDYSPYEAKIMDPQQRIFLECSWEALESAGYCPDNYQGAIGVFGGVSMNTYLLNHLQEGRLKFGLEMAQLVEIALGNDKDFLCTRVSYKLGLKGPSVNVQSACSTSLVAIHLASTSLRNRECDIAIAGAVSVRFPHCVGYSYQPGSIVSPDGACRAFDKSASGTVFGHGAGVAVLKRLEDAIKDKDTILAVIKGSAINNDGKNKVSFTAPSVETQAEVIKHALLNSGVISSSISYIETHGTGTILGDPIEVAALKSVYTNTSLSSSPKCYIGSVKPNIGHLDVAAGMGGFIKTVLALQNRKIPPTLFFKEPNPKLNLENTNFIINNKLENWNGNGTKNRAAVNALGVGGTNAHVILEEAPSIMVDSEECNHLQLVLLSGKRPEDLTKVKEKLLKHLNANLNIKLTDLCFTLAVGRKHFTNRSAYVCSDIAKLKDYLIDKKNDHDHFNLNDDIFLLKEKWLSGSNIDWQSHYKNAKFSRIPLPTYPFKKIIHDFEKINFLTENNNDFFYRCTWNEAKTPAIFTPFEGVSIIFFEKELCKILLAELRQTNSTVIAVIPGEEFKQISVDIYSINYFNAQNFNILFDNIVHQIKQPLKHIIFLHSQEISSVQDELFSDIEELRIPSCALSVMSLLQSVSSCKSTQDIKLILATFNSQKVQNFSNQLNPLQSLSWGMGRVFVNECPKQKIVMIDIDLESSSKQISEIIKSSSNYNNTELAVRQNKFYFSALARIEENFDISNKCKISPKATYIITGGLGALGNHAAKWLIERGALNIVILSRSINEKLEKDLKNQYSTSKVQITFISVDISNKNNLKVAFDTINSSLPPIKGIIHAAGVAEDSLLKDQSFKTLLNVYKAKVHGAWNLHQLSYSYNLDFMIFYSSFSAFAGTQGQLNYVSANVFLSALSAYRQEKGLPSSCFSWGPWGLGMSETFKDINKEYGFSLVSREIAKKTLDSFTNSTADLLIVKADWQQFLLNQNQVLTSPILSLVQILNKAFPGSNKKNEEIFSTQKILLKEEITLELISILREILGLNNLDDIPTDQGFQQLGLTSLSSIKFRQKIVDTFSFPLSTSFTFDYPSIEKATDYLLKNLNDQTSSTQKILSKEEITLKLSSTLREILGLNNLDDIPTNQGFQQLGLTSLSSIKFRQKIVDTFSFPLSTSFTFDYPSIEKATDYLLKNLNIDLETKNLKTEKKITLSDFATLSDEEAFQYLNKTK